MIRGARARARASVVSIVFLLLGVWIFFEAFQVPLGSFRMPGVGFFPLLLGMTLSVFSILLLGMSLLCPADRSSHVGPERPWGAIWVSWRRWPSKLRERSGQAPAEMLVDGGFAAHDDLIVVARPDVGCTVYAPGPEPRDPTRDPHPPRPGDPEAIAQWRQRMGTEDAKRIYKSGPRRASA